MILCPPEDNPVDARGHSATNLSLTLITYPAWMPDDPAKKFDTSARKLLCKISIFLKGPKVNVIARREFELAFSIVTVLHISYGCMATPIYL